MAIINCPECGEKISNTAKNCIHCGCEFLICSECGNVILGEVEECPQCGYLLQKTSQSVAKSKDELSTLPKMIETWGREKPLVKYATANSYPAIICLLISAALLIIGVFTLLNWSLGGLDDAMNFDDSVSRQQGYFVFSAIFFLLSSLFTQCQIFWRASSVNRWVYGKKIDLLPLLKQELGKDYSGITATQVADSYVSTLAAIRAKKYETDYNAKQKEIKVIMFSVIGTGVAALLATIFFVTNTESIMNHLFWDSGADVKGLIGDWWLLILAVAVWGIKCFISGRMDKSVEKSDDIWVKNNLPNEFNTYEKYVKNFVEYLENSAKKS